MRASENEGSRQTVPPPPTSSPANLPHSFFDPPTINNISLGGALPCDPSALSLLAMDLERTSSLVTPPPTAAAISASNSLNRRGQAYRRTNAASGAGMKPRLRSLEKVALNMKSDVELSGPVASTADATTGIQRPFLTWEALAEHMDPLISSYRSTPPTPHDGLPLLTVGHFAAASATMQADVETASAALRSREDVEGSVHVAVHSQSPSELLGSPPQGMDHLHTSAPDSGFELSMESVTLQLPERRYFRLHPVMYLDDCSLHITPGSMHCVASLNPVHARAVLAVLAGVDMVTSAKGATLANALPTFSLRYRRRVAYVASLDCCIEEATVYENLVFATRIRYLVEAATLHEAVETVAADTFLTNYLYTRASDLGAARRYLLATAMELVAEPTVLLMQDPLSFFSLAELQLFTQLLHSMRRRNPARTVVWSASKIPWTLFDSINSLTLLTTGGKIFYTGSKENLEVFLQEDLGILRVPGEDAMDIMAQTEVDTVAVTHSTIAFHNSKFHREVEREIDAHRTRISTNAFPALQEPPRPSPPYASVQSSLLLYTLRRNVFGKAALMPWLGLFVVMMLVCILVAVADGQQEKGLQNTCGVLFLLLSCSVQINAVFFKSELRDWRTFLSFRNNLYFPVLPYYVATIVRLLAPRLCFAMAGSICGTVIFAQATAASLGAMIALLSFAHACLGLIAVYWFPRLEMLMVANHLYYAYCAIFSGFLISITQVPLFFQGLSLLRIAYGGLLAKEICALSWCSNATEDGNSSSSSSAAPDNPSDCVTGKSFLMLMGLQNDSLGKSICGLAILSLVMMVALGISMHLSPRAKLFSAA